MADALTDKTFRFELVSPEAVLASIEATMVIVPGEEGEFGVLADHAPLLSSMRPGVVAVTAADGTQRKIFVSGGFADVTGTQCSVLAEEAIDVADLNREALAAKLADLTDDLEFAKDDAVKSAHIRREIDIVRTKIEVAETVAKAA
jgi:F-type H+-transporting ATPase subunit epsilon